MATELIDSALSDLRTLGRSGQEARVAVAPGRVNLIGEHTDYNDGFVLPVAIDRYAVVAYAPRDDGVLRVHSLDFGEVRDVDLESLSPGAETGWFAYVAGVVWALGQAGVELRGADLSIAGDVPIGAGLASSASLEVAVARALSDLAGGEWHPQRMASICRRAENEFVGVDCGIMDQYAAAAACAGCAMLLDCRSLAVEFVPIPDEVAIVVMDTGVRRKLTAGDYNARRASCARAIDAIAQVDPSARSLRDVEPRLLQAAEHLMDPVTYNRARHVVGEARRPVEMSAALAAGDLGRVGDLVEESHASLRDLYQVSCQELDAMVTSARQQPGCIGARMTGAGFGGCAVALVHTEVAAAFVAGVATRYAALVGRSGTAYVVRAAAGAALIAP